MLGRIIATIVFTFVMSASSVAVASPSAPTLTIDRNLGKVAGWSIGYSNSLKGCLAAAAYGDGTTLWFGGGDRGAYVAFTNPKWRSIDVGGVYDIVLETHNKRWHGEFVGFARDDAHGLFQSSLNDKFILDLSESGQLIVRYSGKILATLSLVGSTDAFEAVVACQKNESPGEDKHGSRHKLEAGMSSMGTGFSVSERGHVLTNNHVIADCSQYLVRHPGGPSIEAQLVAKDPVNDLAVLSTDVPQKTVPPLSVRARAGEDIYVYGFPQPNTLALTGNFTVGNVTATAGMGTTHAPYRSPHPCTWATAVVPCSIISGTSSA